MGTFGRGRCRSGGGGDAEGGGNSAMARTAAMRRHAACGGCEMTGRTSPGQTGSLAAVARADAIDAGDGEDAAMLGTASGGASRPAMRARRPLPCAPVPEPLAADRSMPDAQAWRERPRLPRGLGPAHGRRGLLLFVRDAGRSGRRALEALALPRRAGTRRPPLSFWADRGPEQCRPVRRRGDVPRAEPEILGGAGTRRPPLSAPVGPLRRRPAGRLIKSRPIAIN